MAETPPFQPGDRVQYCVPRGFTDLMGRPATVVEVHPNPQSLTPRDRWNITVAWDDRKIRHNNGWAYWAFELIAPLTPFESNVRAYITRELGGP